MPIALKKSRTPGRSRVADALARSKTVAPVLSLLIAVRRFLPDRVTVRLRHVYPYLRLRGYREHLRAAPRSRALLAYLPWWLDDETRGLAPSEFSNDGIARSFGQVLNELGYVVDCIRFDDPRFRPREHFGLIVQHTGATFPTVGSLRPTDTRLIHFATRTYWQTANARLAERARSFEERTNVRALTARPAPPDDDALRASDAIIALGEERVCAGYRDLAPTFALNNAVYPGPPPGRRRADARYSFLFYAGDGNVHKGLDLAIEAFADGPLVLHVATRLDPEIELAYGELLARNATVVYHGWLPPQSRQFVSLAQSCAFVILPTCAEGQPGSVLECMNRGMVPLVTTHANLDVSTFGFLIGERIPDIREAAGAASELADGELEARAATAAHVARTRHSPALFRLRLREHLEAVAAHHKPGAATG